MKKRSRAINDFWLYQPLVLLMLLTFSACYEPVNGCLDIYASNFNANADKPCEADEVCCNYPELKLIMSHLWGEESFRYDSIFFSNGSADSIRLVQIIYYLSGAYLSGPEGNLRIADEINVDLGLGVNQKITDDFVLIDYIKGRQYTWGTFKTAGTYDSLHLLLGLPDRVLNADPTSFPAGNVMGLQADSMWQEGRGYPLGRLRLVSQANNNDTLEYFIPAEGNSLQLSFPLDTIINFGVTTSINMRADYQKWLAGIDFVAIGAEEAKVVAEIVKNLPNAISLGE